MTATGNYELIIGLEIHVQLQTATKLFCGCETRFGEPANTLTCHVCTGMPGALPVLNQTALDLAIKAGLALNCSIERNTKWDRKNYFYPDLPKGYQISQFDRPICYDGYVDVVDAKGKLTNKRVRIQRAHLEEDAGKSNHDESGQGGPSKIDLNRAGTPLLEIVTHPDLTSGVQAKDFLSELKLILTDVAVSDCNMQQGNLRVDANVNLKVLDSNEARFTPIVEVKNLNSFRAVERAIEFETGRQWKEFQELGKTKETTPKQTRGWNDSRQETYLQREKEDSADYRYFPDPDLVNIRVADTNVDSTKASLGELPDQSRQRLTGEFKLSENDAHVLVRQGRAVVQFFDAVQSEVQNPKLVSNWIQQEVLRYLNEHDLTINQYPIPVSQFCCLLKDVAAKNLDQTRAKEVLEVMTNKNCDFESAKSELGIKSVDESEINQLCEQLLHDNPNVVEEVKSGNAKAIGALIGQARGINPNANPGVVRQKLLELIGS